MVFKPNILLLLIYYNGNSLFNKIRKQNGLHIILDFVLMAYINYDFQLVWAESTTLGCGIHLCPVAQAPLFGTTFENSYFVVCNYGPA